MSYIIVGLGNPGEEYSNTRHNVGRIILDHIKNAYESSEWKLDKKLSALVSKGEVEGDKMTLIEPETFMNNSGKSLKPLMLTEKKANKLVVVYDDLDLPFGTMKMSFDRGSGGHKGLESIIKAIKTRAFIRIRVGISPATPSGKLKKPLGDLPVQKHILGEFKKPELDVLKKEAKRVIEILPLLFSEGLGKAMTEFNSR
jgi:PTH1 family peptidyl-tRNA hydrolase